MESILYLYILGIYIYILLSFIFFLINFLENNLISCFICTGNSRWVHAMEWSGQKDFEGAATIPFSVAKVVMGLLFSSRFVCVPACCASKFCACVYNMQFEKKI